MSMTLFILFYIFIAVFVICRYSSLFTARCFIKPFSVENKSSELILFLQYTDRNVCMTVIIVYFHSIVEINQL